MSLPYDSTPNRNPPPPPTRAHKLVIPQLLLSNPNSASRPSAKSLPWPIMPASHDHIGLIILELSDPKTTRLNDAYCTVTQKPGKQCNPQATYTVLCGVQDFKGAAALSAESKALAAQADISTATAKKLRQQASALHHSHSASESTGNHNISQSYSCCNYKW